MIVGVTKTSRLRFVRAFRLLLEEIAEHRDVAQDRHFVARFGHFVLKQTADRERVAALDQDV